MEAEMPLDLVDHRRDKGRRRGCTSSLSLSSLLRPSRRREQQRAPIHELHEMPLLKVGNTNGAGAAGRNERFHGAPRVQARGGICVVRRAPIARLRPRVSAGIVHEEQIDVGRAKAFEVVFKVLQRRGKADRAWNLGSDEHGRAGHPGCVQPPAHQRLSAVLIRTVERSPAEPQRVSDGGLTCGGRRATAGARAESER